MGGSLALDLLSQSSWFNDALTARMEVRGFEPLSRPQAFVMAQLQTGPVRPAAMARRLGVSRQAVQQLVRPLTNRGLVEITPDPADRRATLIHPTLAGIEFGLAAAEEHRDIEAMLERRIGRGDLDDLRRILSLDWGAIDHDRTDS